MAKKTPSDGASTIHVPSSIPASPNRSIVDLALDSPTIDEVDLRPLLAMTYEPEPSSDVQAEPGVSPHITRRLYISHFLSTWNSRSFEFGAVLFLADIFPGTLLQLSIYALLRSASAIVLASAIGHAVDQRERLPVVRFSIVAARIAVFISCLGFWALSTYNTLWMSAKLGIFSILVTLSCVEKPCSVLNLLAIERDWVVEIAEHDERNLQSLNARMRRIDLICKLVGPLVVALIHGASTSAAIFLTLATNAAAAPLEYIAIAQVYRAVPQLQIPKVQSQSDASVHTPTSRPGRAFRISPRQLLAPLQDITFYFQHRAFLPSLALSLLYFTVLSMSGQQITYLVSAGFSSSTIGFVRALSTVFELSATWVAPHLMRKIGAPRAGMWFLSWQVSWLGSAVALFWAARRPSVAASGLVAGTILSRMGLWGYDLSVQFIIQQEVNGPHRGAFSSMEASLQNFFELLSYATTIIWSSPAQFRYPVLLSAVAVYTAAGLHAFFLRRRRGHLVHLSTCIK